MQAERPMSGVKSRGLLERGKEKQEVVGELCLLVRSVETKPNISLKWITFLEMSIIIKQTHISDLTNRKHVQYDKPLSIHNLSRSYYLKPALSSERKPLKLIHVFAWLWPTNKPNFELESHWNFPRLLEKFRPRTNFTLYKELSEMLTL